MHFSRTFWRKHQVSLATYQQPFRDKTALWLNAPVGAEFEDQDLSASVFWGVNLKGTLFRDAAFDDSRFFHVSMANVSVDGVIDGLVVNGVDVTAFVNSNDRWYPLRNQLSPDDEEGIRRAWSQLVAEWNSLYEFVKVLPEAVTNVSVKGEWSLRDTLRHMVFVHDKWFNWPLLGKRSFEAIGLPNTGSQGNEWPGLDLASEPRFDEVFAQRRTQVESLGRYLDGLELTQLLNEVEILENGVVPSVMCFHAVLEEEFEHLRYAWRDIEQATR